MATASAFAVTPSGPPLRSAWRERGALFSIWCLAAVLIFAPLARPGRMLGFRDAGHYYPPLLQLVHRAWHTGAPLWNRWEEGGRPLLADPTAAALYPGQLVFALPCTFATNYAVYVIAHVLLAGWTTYRASRSWQLSRAASLFASMSYALSGTVVFQVHNVPYLIGAAWLPLAMSQLFALFEKLRWNSTCQLALAWSMMVLGGDLQLAYLLVVVAGAVCFLRVLSCRSHRTRFSDWPQHLALANGRWLPAFALGLALTSAQWLPTATWSLASERMTGNASVADGSDNKPSTSRFDFSVPPWRWVETVWPQFSGHVVPRHTRWLQACGYEDRFWTLSLYQGMSVILLVVPGFRSPLAPRWRLRALACLVVLGCWGSLGSYDVGSLFPSAALADAKNSSHGTWGLYWLLSQLPLFSAFRFPGKMWVWAAFAISQLAAHGWDACRVGESSFASTVWRRRWIVMIAIWCAALLFVGFVMGFPGSAPANRIAPHDPIWGPLLESRAWRQLIAGGIHAIVVLWVLQQSSRWQGRGALPWLLITAIDIGWAHHNTITTIPIATIGAQSPLRLSSEAKQVSPKNGPVTRYLRLSTLGWYPQDWQRTSSPRRLEECVAWDRWTLRPKYNLLEDWVAMGSNTSFSTRDHRERLRALDECREHSLDAWVNALRYWGIRYVIGNTSLEHPHLQAQLLPANDQTAAGEVKCYEVTDVIPRVRWVASGEWKRPTTDGLSLKQLVGELWRRDDLLTLAQQTVWLDASSSAEPLKSTKSTKSTNPRDARRAHCEITVDSDCHLVIEVDSPAAGWVVVQDSYDPGWRAELSNSLGTHPVSLVATLAGERAFPVPAGRSSVVLRYEPKEWICGRTVSSIAWIGMGLMSIGRCRRRRDLENCEPRGYHEPIPRR